MRGCTFLVIFGAVWQHRNSHTTTPLTGPLSPTQPRNATTGVRMRESRACEA
eukprot:m.5565 g.5565  ORF g.5565 m.5565 type:complete len:52 (+) comp3728_c0_seq1:405-560(+)